MKKTLLLISLSLFAVINAGAQGFWLENWTGSSCSQGCTTYTGSNGAWSIVATGANGAAANLWYFSYQEEGMSQGQCGQAGSSGSPVSAHIGNVSTSPAAALICPSGDCGALNDDYSGSPSTRTNTRLESPVIDCTGKNNITLSFNYILQGYPGHDSATVWYYNGASWSLLAKPPATNNGPCSGQGYWTRYSVALPSSANNNANVQIGFNWMNDTLGYADTYTAYPSIAVDSITLSTPPLGINSLQMANSGFNIEPNPNNGVFCIEHRNPSEWQGRAGRAEKESGETVIEIYNMMGQRIFQAQYPILNTKYKIDLSGQPAGIYLCRVVTQTGQQVAEGKIMIK